MATKALMDLVFNTTKGNTKALWHIYNTIQNWFPANGFANRFEIAYSDSVGGDWLSETGPNDNAYIVIRPNAAYPWGDATRWQLLVTARNTAGAGTVAGVVGGRAIPGQNLYLSFSANGGWNDVTKTWSGALGTAVVIGFSAAFTATAPSQFNVMGTEHLTSGVADGPVLSVIAIQGTNCGGFTVGKLTAHDPASEVYPCQFLYGTIVSGWNGAGGTNGQVPAIGAAATNLAYTIAPVSGSLGLSRTGKWAGKPVELIDRTMGRTVGFCTGFYSVDSSIADGAQDTANTFRVFDGYMFAIA
jgi:hypothetical protein